MNQFEQKRSIEKEIYELKLSLREELDEMSMCEAILGDAQNDYNQQYACVIDIRRHINELKESLGMILEGQISIDDVL